MAWKRLFFSKLQENAQVFCFVLKIGGALGFHNIYSISDNTVRFIVVKNQFATAARFEVMIFMFHSTTSCEVKSFEKISVRIQEIELVIRTVYFI